MADAVDMDKMNALAGKFVTDIGAALAGANVLLGEQLGLYKALAKAGPSTPEELAKTTGIRERYLREWLSAQATSGYVEYKEGKFWMTPEQKLALSEDTGPAYFGGAFSIVASVYKDERRIAEAIQKGQGFGWHEHHVDLFSGTSKFFRPGYVANLISNWLPALEGVVAKLQAGARVADVGCGLGSSTISMAKAFPKSTFVGYDYHAESIEWARNEAVTAGVSGNVDFEVASAQDYRGSNFDLVTFFDCLHDMGDPTGASKHVRSTLKPDGTWMVVEPMAGDRLEDNLNPVAGIFYQASTLICVPGSLAQEGAAGLGAQASGKSLEAVFRAGGFSRVRIAATTPVNRIFEIRP